MADRLVIQGIYRHFKGNIYQVKCLADDSETGEKVVVYQALYGDYRYYVRPLDMFLSRVDKTKYPDAGQEYRFELCENKPVTAPIGDTDILESVPKEDSAGSEIKVPVEPVKEQPPAAAEDLRTDSAVMDPDEKLNNYSVYETAEDDDTPQIDPDVLDFLDATDYDKRLEVLERMKYKITNDMIDVMSTVIDIEIAKGDVGERYENFKEALVTRRHYECSRLRTSW